MSLHDVIKNLRLLSPWSVAIGSIMMFSLASCYDIGDRDNPLDPGASNYVTPKDSDEVSSSSKSKQSSSSSKKAEGSSSSKDSKPVEKSSSSKKSELSSSVNQNTSKKSSESRSSSSGNNANSSSPVSQISSGNTSSSSSKKIESSSSKTALSSSTSTLSSSSINLESVLGYCTVVIADSIGLVGSTYYICKSGKWEKASVVEYDTYKQKCLTDGSIVDGNVISLNKYVCDDGVFRAATENDVRAELGCTSYTRGEYRILSGQYSYYKCESEGWLFTTEKLNQGTMTDKRDGHVYKTIGIKNQMWMAENLNYQYLQPTVEWDSSSFCYNNDLKYCETYGRIYIWSAAMDSVGLYSSNGKGCGWGAFSENCSPVFPVRGVCPNGWHLPSYGEWNMLFSNVGGVSKAGSVLKSTSGWVGRMGNGSDTYGLSVFPAGDRHDYGDHYYDSDYGKSASFWSSSVNSLNDNGGGANAFRAYINGDYKDVFVEGYYAYSGFSVRCIKDEE